MPMPQYNGPMYSQGPTAVGPYNLQGYQSTFGYNPQQTYMPNRNRTSSVRFRRGNMVGRRYSGNERRDWGSDTGSEGGTIQHGDMTGMRMTRDMSSMTPDEQLTHLKTDVETMWRDATPEQRKRIKESLTKWSTTLTV